MVLSYYRKCGGNDTASGGRALAGERENIGGGEEENKQWGLKPHRFCIILSMGEV